jgi:hypothetical protein
MSYFFGGGAGGGFGVCAGGLVGAVGGRLPALIRVTRWPHLAQPFLSE